MSIPLNQMLPSDDDVDVLFESSDDIKTQIRETAEWCAIEDDALIKIKDELTTRKATLDLAKEKLCNMLRENGMESCKLESGLNPKAKSVMKYYKAPGIDDATLHNYLKSKDLGDIIQPYVHWQTLNATLKSFEEAGGEVDKAVINPSMTHTVTLYGKSKFLAGREK